VNTVIHERKIIIFSLIIIFLISCASKPETPANTDPDPLDAAIRETSDYLNGRINRGVKLVFLNFQSDCLSLSEYIIDGLIDNTVNDGLFTAVDRQNLALIRQEMNFQFSGEVSDESAQAIGKMLGAQIIVSGAISPLGNSYRLRVRAITVETAEIQGQFNRDIVSSPRLLAILANCNTTAAHSDHPATNTTIPGQAASGSSTVAPIQPSPSASASTASGTALPYERFTVLRQLDVVNTGKFAVSPDGKYVIVDTNTGRRLCDAATGNVIRNIDIPSFSVIAFSPDGRRVITDQGINNIRIFDIESGANRVCSGHTGSINSLAYSRDGRYFVSASSSDGIGQRGGDNTVRIWDAETGQEIRTITGHTSGVGYALFSPDGRTIISHDKNTVNFWDTGNGNLLRNIPMSRHQNYTKLLALTPDGSRIAVADGNKIIIYDTQNGRELFNLTGHIGGVVSMCFNPEGNRLISASNGQTKNLMIWNMASGWGTENSLRIGGGGYASLGLSSDGTVLVINTEGRRTYVLGME
jgi:WD40 repeat protein/TolB-like protein